MGTFSREDIETGLKRLGELAQAKGLHVQLTLVGGAVMVLRFDARPSTRDVDVVILLPREARLVRELAKQVAEELNWAEDWLNDGAKAIWLESAKVRFCFKPQALKPVRLRWNNCSP